jgi:DNA-binding GntR family transcriptional regulator
MASDSSIDGRQRTQIRDEVVLHLQGQILAGNVKPGELLRLAPIAAELRASITPVREALLLLSQNGIVAQEPNRGFRVLPIGRRDVQDSYVVHGFVAGELTARAADAIGEEDLDGLRELDAQIRKVSAGGEKIADAARLEVDLLNSKLHTAIYDLANSPRLIWFRDSASNFVPRRHWGTVPGWIDLNRDGHSKIIDALAAGDLEVAREAMRAHITAAGDLLLEHLDGLDFWDQAEVEVELG